MKIFLSTSFSSKVLPDGRVEPSYRTHLEKIIESLEQKGHSVFCGLREDGWRLNDVAPGEAFVMDANAVQDCDLVVALIRNNPPSAGIQFELGIAYALKKKVILLWQADDVPVPYINQGLLESDLASGTVYHSLAEVPGLLATQIR
jgi:nucleoside 2-deoxyribosyltransferase